MSRCRPMTGLLMMLLVLCAGGLASGAEPLIYRKGQTRIMPLGDSITYASGWRVQLQDLLRANGYTFRFVGGRNDPRTDDLHSSGQSGYFGWTIGDFPISKRLGGGDADWVHCRPDLILLHIGTNDLQLGLLDHAKDRLAALIHRLQRDLPGCAIIVARIIPFAPVDRKNVKGELLAPQTRLYDDDVSEVVASEQANGHRVALVDMESAINPATDLADGVHPNVQGYHKMALRWLQAIESVTGRRDHPPTPLPPVVQARVNGTTHVSVAMGTYVYLNGILVDDDRKSGPVSFTWSAVEGPAPVTFAAPHGLTTSAIFSQPGAYCLALTATHGNDASGQHAGRDLVRVVVQGTPAASPDRQQIGRVISLSLASALSIRDVAGVIPRPDWNVVPGSRINEGVPFYIGNLKDDHGVVTSLGYRLVGNDVAAQRLTGPAATPDAELMAGGMTSANDCSHVLFDIPYPVYDLYLYFRRCDSDPVNQNVVNPIGLFTFDSDHWVVSLYGREVGSFQGFTALPCNADADLQARSPVGNYVRIPGLTLKSIRVLIPGPIDAPSGRHGVPAGLCGLQLVESVSGPSR